MTVKTENEVISDILCGSCTPACDLLEKILNGDISYEAAFSAYNARLRWPVVSLYDAVDMERNVCARLDI